VLTKFIEKVDPAPLNLSFTGSEEVTSDDWRFRYKRKKLYGEEITSGEASVQ